MRCCCDNDDDDDGEIVYRKETPPLLRASTLVVVVLLGGGGFLCGPMIPMTIPAWHWRVNRRVSREENRASSFVLVSTHRLCSIQSEFDPIFSVVAYSASATLYHYYWLAVPLHISLGGGPHFPRLGALYRRQLIFHPPPDPL